MIGKKIFFCWCTEIVTCNAATTTGATPDVKLGKRALIASLESDDDDDVALSEDDSASTKGKSK